MTHTGATRASAAVTSYLAREPQQQVDDDVHVLAVERLGGVGLEPRAGLRARPARVQRLAGLIARLLR